MSRRGTLPSSSPWRLLRAVGALMLGGLALANARAFASLDPDADGTLAMSFEYFVIVPLTAVSVVAHALTLVRGRRRWDALELVIVVGELAAMIGIVAFHVI